MTRRRLGAFLAVLAALLGACSARSPLVSDRASIEVPDPVYLDGDVTRIPLSSPQAAVNWEEPAGLDPDQRAVTLAARRSLVLTRLLVSPARPRNVRVDPLLRQLQAGRALSLLLPVYGDGFSESIVSRTPLRPIWTKVLAVRIEGNQATYDYCFDLGPGQVGLSADELQRSGGAASGRAASGGAASGGAASAWREVGDGTARPQSTFDCAAWARALPASSLTRAR